MNSRPLTLFSLLLLAATAQAQPVPGDLLLTEQNGGSGDDGTVVNIRVGGDFMFAPRFATGMGTPQDICVGPNGDLYVTEDADGAITVITDGGDFTAATSHATGLSGPIGLLCTDTQILVVEFDSGEVTDATSGGNLSLATPFAEGLDGPSSIFRDSNGTLWVTEHFSGEVTSITGGGNFSGVAPYAANAPSGSGLMSITEWEGALLVAALYDDLVIDFTAGGDLSMLPVYAVVSGVGRLEAAPGLGLFAVSIDGLVYEISSSVSIYASGIGNIHAPGGLHYVSGCGDGITEGGEECDDGNTRERDGCSSSCLFGPVCGNGVTQPPEECDDGNTADGDGCSSECLVPEPSAPLSLLVGALVLWAARVRTARRY